MTARRPSGRADLRREGDAHARGVLQRDPTARVDGLRLGDRGTDAACRRSAAAPAIAVPRRAARWNSERVTRSAPPRGGCAAARPVPGRRRPARSLRRCPRNGSRGPRVSSIKSSPAITVEVDRDGAFQSLALEPRRRDRDRDGERAPDPGVTRSGHPYFHGRINRPHLLVFKTGQVRPNSTKSMQKQEPKRVLAVVSDLFFSVKLTEAAKRAGLALEFVKESKEVLEKALEQALADHLRPEFRSRSAR